MSSNRRYNGLLELLLIQILSNFQCGLISVHLGHIAIHIDKIILGAFWPVLCLLFLNFILDHLKSFLAR